MAGLAPNSCQTNEMLEPGAIAILSKYTIFVLQMKIKRGKFLYWKTKDSNDIIRHLQIKQSETLKVGQ